MARLSSPLEGEAERAEPAALEKTGSGVSPGGGGRQPACAANDGRSLKRPPPLFPWR
jgi:hypothetical protein